LLFIAINYRLAPETRFPGQLHDAVSAYMRLIVDLQIPPENIIFAGDSAGAGLALATMMYLRDEGYPLPSGAILMSPWVDLTMSCEVRFDRDFFIQLTTTYQRNQNDSTELDN
jgi:acetyl esterase/lipase